MPRTEPLAFPATDVQAIVLEGDTMLYPVELAEFWLGAGKVVLALPSMRKLEMVEGELCVIVPPGKIPEKRGRR